MPPARLVYATYLLSFKSLRKNTTLVIKQTCSQVSGVYMLVMEAEALYIELHVLSRILITVRSLNHLLLLSNTHP